MKKVILFTLMSILVFGLVSGEGLGQVCIDKTAPSAPVNLTVSGEVGNIILSWITAIDEPSCSGIDYYQILRDNVSLGNTTNLNFTDTDNSLTSGNYTYQVYAVDKVGHNVGVTINNNVVIENNVVTGGGSSSSFVTQNTFETYNPSEVELKEGFAKRVGEDDKILFDFEEEKHSVEILNVDYNRIDLVVSSTPQYASFLEGESKSFDLNNDNILDITIKIENLNESSADLEIQLIEEKTNIENIKEDLEENNEETEGFFSAFTGAVIGTLGTGGSIAVLVLILGIIVLLVILGVARKKKKKVVKKVVSN